MATPTWVRARALAAELLVFQSTMAVGSFAWGALAERFGNGTVPAAAALAHQWQRGGLALAAAPDPAPRPVALFSLGRSHAGDHS
jgi:Transmembrane secretion effector